MAANYLEVTQLDECLNVILKSNLAFQSKKEFADFAGYPSLLKNNPITKLPYQRKLELLFRIQASFPIDFSKYDSLLELVKRYQTTSRFFRAFIGEKKGFQDVETAVRMVDALYIHKQLTGNSRLDKVLSSLYDFKEREPLQEDVDVDIFLLMMMGVLPPVSERQKQEAPDFDSEWSSVKALILRCFQITPNVMESSLINETLDHWDKPGFLKSRLYYITTVGQAIKNIREAAAPQDMYRDPIDTKLEGLWQSYEKGTQKEANVFYEFSKFGRCYTLRINEVFPSVINYSEFSCFFYEYDVDTPVVMIEHPKAGYWYLIKGKGNEDYETYLKFKTDMGKTPENIWFDYFHGARMHELSFTHLKKLSDEKEAQLRQSWEAKKRVNLFSDYACTWSGLDLILTITKDCLFIKDPDIPDAFYKVPKSIDSRLKSLTADSECAFLTIGNDPARWIVFPSLALYFPPDRFAQLGIEKTDKPY